MPEAAAKQLRMVYVRASACHLCATWVLQLRERDNLSFVSSILIQLWFSLAGLFTFRIACESYELVLAGNLISANYKHSFEFSIIMHCLHFRCYI